jgi:hypothetical protein
MKAIPVQSSEPALRQRRQRRSPGIVPQAGQTTPSAREQKLHAQLKSDAALKSGRSGAYVYYMRKGRQCWRRYVIPRDPRTTAQRRSRQIFGATSRTWSENESLTEAQRQAWYEHGAKRSARPRLGLSGRLTGQQDFVGRNCSRQQRDSHMLLHPLKHNQIKVRSKARQPERTLQTQLPQTLLQSTWDTRRGLLRTPRYRRAVPRGYLRKSKRRLRITQPAIFQPFTQSTWDRPHTSPVVVPSRYRGRGTAVRA